jgi:hypothetical protein
VWKRACLQGCITILEINANNRNKIFRNIAGRRRAGPRQSGAAPTPAIGERYQIAEETAKPKLSGVGFGGKFDDAHIIKGIREALKKCNVKNSAMTTEPNRVENNSKGVSFKAECR